MTQAEDHAPEAPDHAPVERPPRSTLFASALTLVVLAVGTVVFGFTPAIFVALYAGMFAAAVAVPYTLVAIVARELIARREGRRRPDDQRFDAAAVRFALFRQRASLVTASIMVVVLVVAIVVFLVAVRDTDGTFIPALFSGGLLYFGVFALVSGVFSIVVNAPSVYSGRVVASERRAIRERSTAGRLILATTILTTASWIGYSVFGLLLLGQMVGW